MFGPSFAMTAAARLDRDFFGGMGRFMLISNGMAGLAYGHDYVPLHFPSAYDWMYYLTTIQRAIQLAPWNH